VSSIDERSGFLFSGMHAIWSVNSLRAQGNIVPTNHWMENHQPIHAIVVMLTMPIFTTILENRIAPTFYTPMAA